MVFDPTETLSEVVNFRLTPSDVARLDRERVALGVRSRSEVLRWFLARGPALRNADVSAPATADQLSDLLEAVRATRADAARVGNNLNQVARGMNAVKVEKSMFNPPTAEEVRRALDGEAEIREALAALVQSLEDLVRSASRRGGVA